MGYVTVHVVGKSAPEKVPITSETVVEDVITEICKLLKISPLAKHLFSVRLFSSKIWLNLCLKADDIKSDELEFKYRYKLPDMNRLKEIDINAYNFYFNQVKHGILSNKIPDISYDAHKNEIIGLCVLDMLRATIEDDVSKDEVEREYRKFIPNEILKKHLFFVKKPVVNALNDLKSKGKVDEMYIKSSYLNQFKKLAPDYLTEDYRALISDVDNFCDVNTFSSVDIKVDPYHEEFPGIRIKLDEKDDHICTIDDLCYLSIRNDGTVIISRKNGIPIYLKFHSLPVMKSFVTLLDSYYRLMVKWTFNLCKDLPCPSLQRLANIKCHGPVSGEFSYRKLADKKNNKLGCYVLRESDIAYNTYYLDVCIKNNSKPVTFKIEMTDGGQFVMDNNRSKTYRSLKDLLNDYKSSNNEILLKECVPPSEFDQSNLLLCQVNNNSISSFNSSINKEELLNVPVCIDTRTLKVFRNMARDGCCSLTTVYRGQWCKNKTTKLNVAIKVLNEKNHQKHLTEFLSLTSRWTFVNSNSTIKIYGVALANPISMVMEYLPLGQLDLYLSNPNNRASIKEVDLVEASTHLAKAFWDLEEAGFVHGNIRCRKLLVAAHAENKFVVKLSDPGLYSAFADMDIHWIPPECYKDLDSARYSSAADVWAFGTTLWEIFSYGKSPPNADAHNLKKFYLHPRYLPKPADCPSAVYQLMLECWERDPHYRKKQQAAMRDINQILYQVYNSRQNYYSPISPRQRKDSASNKFDSIESSTSFDSENTLETWLNNSGEQISISGDSTLNDTNDLLEEPSICSWDFRYISDKNEISPIIGEEDLYRDAGTISSIQSIFVLNKEWNLIYDGRIGEGFYGEVYRGRLEHMHDEEEPQLVAVKKMKMHTTTDGSRIDFDREIGIMLKLEHTNIVQVKGIIQDPELCLVLEYIEHGSLQCYLKIHKDRLTADHLLRFALDVAKGMAYLTEKKVIHRDLAARNILVVNENSVKISDFGLARFIGNNNYYIFKTERDLPIKWYAPESIEFGKFSHRSDVWSYGVTLFEMFSFGEDPIIPCISQDQYSICAALKRGVRLPCPETCSHIVYAHIMLPCWKYNASQRPSFLQIISTIDEIFSPLIEIKYETQPLTS